MSNVKSQMSNVKSQKSNVKSQMSNVKMSNENQMSNVSVRSYEFSVDLVISQQILRDLDISCGILVL